MKATEIIEKFKSVLLSSETEEAVKSEKEVELKEEVKVTKELLAEEEEAPEAPQEEAPKEEAPEEEEEKFATKEELSKAIAEFRALYEQLLEMIEPMEAKDAPEELSSQEEAKEIVHSPEANVEKREINLYSQKRASTTMDRVFAKLNK